MDWSQKKIRKRTSTAKDFTQKRSKRATPHTDWMQKKWKSRPPTQIGRKGRIKRPHRMVTQKKEIEYTNNHEGLSNYSIYFNNYYSGRIDVDI